MATKRHSWSKSGKKSTLNKRSIRAKDGNGKMTVFHVGDLVKIVNQPAHLRHHYKHPERVRGCFVDETLREPYARNTHQAACVLTTTSWVPCSDLVKV